MAPLHDTTGELQALLNRAGADDRAVWDELIHRASGRIMRLTRKMFRSYPGLASWEQTDDIFQNAVLRLHRSLADAKPATVREFFGLAAVQIRRTLIDLCRHHFGSTGANRRPVSLGGAESPHPEARPAHGEDPAALQVWVAFHEAVEQLPDEERELFSLVWYGGMSQREAREILGISERTAIRRMQRARLTIYQLLDGQLPTTD